MEIRLPDLGENTESGTVAAIFVSAGDSVVRDQAIIELESEKAVASVPSPAAGKIAQVHVKEGDELRKGSLLVTLQVEDEEIPKPLAGVSEARTPEPMTHRIPTEPSSLRVAVESKPAELPDGIAPAASPSIRKFARELGIDLTRVQGSAHGGRIVLGDLRDYIRALQNRSTPESQPAPSPVVDFSQWGAVESIPATVTRKTIAKRMLDSWRRVPHVTQFIHADISRLTDMRRKWRAQYETRGARLTLTPVLLRALARTLPRHPLLNSSYDENSFSIVTKKYYHLGLAVDAEAGLVVPVIRNADQKSLFDLARDVERLSEHARQKKLTREDLVGGTFTVSNQGSIGGEHFTPIINYPEVAILGVGRGLDVVGMNAGKADARPMLPLALSHDHRVVDGADAVRFLTDFVRELEQLPESEFELN